MKGMGIVAVAVVSLVGAGCASKGEDKTDALMDSVQGLEASLSAASTEVDKATSAMNALVSSDGSDPKPLMERYRAGVSGVTSSRKSVKSSGESLRQAIEQHFANWEKEANEIQNPEIRGSMMERRTAAQNRMGSVHPKIENAGKEFDSLVSDLKDIESLLEADLSPGGITAAGPTIQKATEKAVRTKDALKELETVCVEVRENLAVREAPPKQ
jgi:outer membrane murein-binding lipoprotein Lpp